MAKRLLEGPANTKGSALRGNLQVDATRGQMRVRAWPRKRGKNVAPGTKAYNDWFRDCLNLIKKMEPGFLVWCMEKTKGTNIYPRDLAMQLLSGRGVMLTLEDGTKYFPEAFMADVSLSLDSLGQTVGALLFRGPQFWEQLDQGTLGQALISAGPGIPPGWGTPVSGTTIERFGATMFSPGSGTNFVNGNYGGVIFQAPSDIHAASVAWRVRTASGLSQVTPAIYSLNETGTLAALIAAGPTVTGVHVGENVFPLSTQPIIPQGTLICVGARVMAAAVSATTASAISSGNVSASAGLPAPGAALTYLGAGWAGFSIIPA